MTTTRDPAHAQAVALRARHGRLLIVSVLLVSFNMRCAITGVPPLVEQIGTELGLSRSWTGALTTLPVLCMGLFAPVAQRVAHRWGREAAVLAAVCAVVAGSLVRLGGADVALLYVGTFVAGVGIAVGGTLLPGVVKEFYPDRSGVVTGLYMVGMMTGAAVASALAVPLAGWLGSWQASVATWALPAVLGALAWLPVVRRVNDHAAEDEDPEVPGAARVPLPWRQATAWLVAAYLVVQSWQFYSQLAWIAPLYESHGWTAGRAGLLLAGFSAAQIFSGLGGPALADRLHDRRPLLGAAVACNALGLAGMLLAPEAAPWLWVTLTGLGLGAGFALGLVLLVDYAATPAASARLSGMAFLVSYTVASAGPFVLGFLRDATGGFTASFGLLLALVVPQALTVLTLTPRRPRIP